MSSRTHPRYTGTSPRTQEETTMAKVMSAMSMSLDGYVTGPNDSREFPLGIGGDRPHDWLHPPPETPPDTARPGEPGAGGGAGAVGGEALDHCGGGGGGGGGGPGGRGPA